MSPYTVLIFLGVIGLLCFALLFYAYGKRILQLYRTPKPSTNWTKSKLVKFDEESGGGYWSAEKPRNNEAVGDWRLDVPTLGYSEKSKEDSSMYEVKIAPPPPAPVRKAYRLPWFRTSGDSRTKGAVHR